MKNFKLFLSVLLALSLLLCTAVGVAEEAAETTETEATGSVYSEGIDENGLWEGVTAVDHIEMFEYKGIEIPADVHTITDEAVAEQVSAIMSEFTQSEHITDRAIADGDTVNIDFVGSVDGVEFEGGSTGGVGTDVTIGVTSYIDDFLEQLIGHTPGESVDVEVTFPEDYGVEELNGKDALFVTTLNYIVEVVEPELTDAFVAGDMAAYGWTSIDEMETALRDELKQTAIDSFLREYLLANVTVSSVPDSMVAYQESAMLNYYVEYAGYFGMDIDSFLTTFMGVGSQEELVAANAETNRDVATYYLIIQAIVEDAGLSVTEEDVSAFFKEYHDTDDYSEYEAMYGMPYLMQAVLFQKTIALLTDNAVLA